MSAEFDPYHQWLGISPKDQPPNHYRLLGIERFEGDADVIQNAADRQMAHVRSFQTGRHAQQSQTLLNEIAKAKVCLLDAGKKAAYDATLGTELQTVEDAPANEPRAVRSTRATREAPAAQPRPQPQQRTATAQAAEFQFAPQEGPVDPARRLARQGQKPAWRQPLVLAGAGGGVALLIVLLAFSVGGGSDPPVDDDLEPALRGAPPPRVAVSGDDADDDPGDGGPPVVARHEPPVAAPDPLIDDVVVPPLPPDPTPPDPAPPASPPGAVNLLQRIDLNRDVIGEPWSLEQGALLAPESANSRIQCAVELPAEYVLTVTVERLSGADSLVLGLVHQGRQFVANFDGWDGSTGGLQLVDGQYAPRNSTVFHRRVLPPGRTITLRCTLHQAGVRVQADDDTLVDWRGEAEQLSMSPEWRIADPRALFLGAARSRFRISRWELAPLPSASGGPSGDDTPRNAVPPAADRDAALAGVKEKFATEYAADNAQDQVALAAALLEESSAAQSGTSLHYALLEEARRLAVATSELQLALRAVEQLGHQYVLDRWELQSETMKGLALAASTLPQRVEFVEKAMQIADATAAQGQYKAARYVASLARTTTLRMRDAPLRRRADERYIELTQANRFWEDAEEARATLADNPDDSEAHANLGHFLCFILEDWEKGLPHLARSNSPFQSLAAAEADGAETAAARADLGHRWWREGRGARSLVRVTSYLRALDWYRLALPDLTGRDKTLAEQRIAEIEALGLRRLGHRTARGTDGLFGRVTVGGSDVGLLLYYRTGKSFREATLQTLLDELGIDSPSKVVELYGLVRVFKDRPVQVRHRGGSPSGGVCWLYLDGQELGSVGDDRSKDSTYDINLPRGDHQIRWVIQGGHIGNALLEFIDPATGNVLEVFHSQSQLQAARQLPTRKEADVSTD